MEVTEVDHIPGGPLNTIGTLTCWTSPAWHLAGSGKMRWACSQGKPSGQLPQGHSAEHSQGLHDVGVTLDLSRGSTKS